MPFWREILDLTGARSVFEVGCNAGWNLLALRTLDPTLELHGIDVNERALAEARRDGISVATWNVVDMPYRQQFDLVFTAGVLIHVPPHALERAMTAIVDSSLSHVLAVEYAAEKEEPICYRGHDALWRRPFGALYEDMGLHLVGHGHAGKGFDDCQWWCLSK
jgi:spore coat polysaccharide biosynthesis protein SpsF